MQLISSSRAATLHRASFTAFSSLFMLIQLEQENFKSMQCPFNFAPVSVTIFSVFWQKSVYRLMNATNFGPPLHLMLPGVKGGKGIATKLDYIQSFRMLFNLETFDFFGGDSTPFTKRSQHFIAMSTFHHSVK